jgi:hypothetical protein
VVVVVDFVVLAGLAAFLVGVVDLLVVAEAGLPWLEADMWFAPVDLLAVVLSVADVGLPWLAADMLPLADFLEPDIMFDEVVDLLAAGFAPGVEQLTNLPLASRHCSALAWLAKAKHAAAAAAR